MIAEVSSILIQSQDTLCYCVTAGDMHIKALRVKCANLGCAWVGELRFLEEHHATCDHALLPCPNECIDGTTPVRVLRKDLATHLKEKCPNRSNQCPHCGEEGKLCDITTSHLESCTKIEVPCPNKGCSAKLPRCDIPEHRKTFCPFEEVACKYSTIGCKEKSLRKELKDHENNDQLHLHIAMEAILKHDSSQTRLNKVETIQQDQLARICTLTGGHFTFKVDKFSQCKASGEAFYSPPFYTHHGGYKMCIKVYANGVGNGEGTHVSEYATLMRGENDDNLTWPFTGDVTVELLNQLEDKEHHQDTIPYRDDKDNEYNSRVVDRERAPSGWGRSTFISHADLGPATTRQFLKDDCLYFRVSVKATPNPKPWLTCTT